ncbi:hypothetical protein QT381_02725 [Galbitalea sp. SE-J8]|uniref:hypothetical protein n=1 Tax=Galbitalea sp. SE-J8 TaxID=3054952 RepID=UPI00259CCC3F|nr:hypothetical protein [Galbitalea sp. SE-J8]MDM4761918.1 hypothetical protein [Galbitalea sp. SE-J8]
MTVTFDDLAAIAAHDAPPVTGWQDEHIGRQHLRPGWAVVTDFARHGDDVLAEDYIGPVLAEDADSITLEIEDQPVRFSRDKRIVTTYDDAHHLEPTA